MAKTKTITTHPLETSASYTHVASYEAGKARLYRHVDYAREYWLVTELSSGYVQAHYLLSGSQREAVLAALAIVATM